MDAEILAAAKVYEKHHPRRDLRGCQSCKDKMQAKMQAMMKIAPCPDRPTKLFVCPVHKLIVSPRICKTCKRDKSFARLFFSEYIRNRAAREKPCKWAGKPIGVEQVACCDGEHTTNVQVYACAIHKKVSNPDCFVCRDYQF